MAGFGARLKHAWNAFLDQNPFDRMRSYDVGASYGYRPDKTRLRYSTEKSIISSIYNRLGMDVAGVDIRHVRLDDNDRYKEDVESGLNYCLTLEANIDQAARALRQDVAMTMFDRGTVAIVPVDTTDDPNITGAFDVKTLRVGWITAWYPQHVRVEIYNESSGRREEVTLAKKFVAVVENPFYTVMNEPNSTMQRLIRKLNLLDSVDEATASGKLDIIIQLPYVIKSEARRTQAQQRRKDLEDQLSGSKYGIGYTDGTEKITQLNRPVENNLLKQIEYLTDMLYGQLGLTKDIMNGTADAAAMQNYYNRTVDPIVFAIVEAMKRTFLTKTARSQKQSILPFRNPFQLIPIEQLADIADKFSRNEIMSPNEIRQAIGLKPSTDPKADKLMNSNMPQPSPNDQLPVKVPSTLGPIRRELTPSESNKSLTD